MKRPDPDPQMPDPDRVAISLADYLEKVREYDGLAMATASAGSELIEAAREIQAYVGDDVAILFRGRVFVPFVADDGARAGYEPMVCLDLDALRISANGKPIIEFADPVPSDQFPRVADDIHPHDGGPTDDEQ